MDNRERYLFDTQGCLIIPSVLSDTEVDRLIAGLPRGGDGSVRTAQDGVTIEGILSCEEPLFRGLIDHPRMLPYLRALCGGQAGDPESHHVQLSHEYGLAMRAGQCGPWFHNGGTPHQPWLAYQVHDGRIFCALVAVIWVLTDVGPSDGGFWYIPGSHKAAFPLPDEIRSYEVIPSCVVQPTPRRGSVILFTEALTHGTKAWTGADQRLALFYKYAPGLMAHVRPVPERHLTDAQRDFLRPNQLRPPP